ncbi:MAG: 50S ribosomal protein L32 [Verrucomicrobiia bacterium]
MGVPKRRMSKMRRRTRKAANRLQAQQTSVCAQCGAQVRTHRVCPSCGYYKGRQIMSVSPA